MYQEKIAKWQAQVEERFDALPLLYLGIKPSPGRPQIAERAREANARIAAEIAGRPQSRFADTIELLAGPDGWGRWDLFVEDGIHLNATGYGLWTELLASYREFLFA